MIKQRRKCKCKAVPVLGIAGLSLSLASGASAAIGGLAADLLIQNARVSYGITLSVEEISDVSLATFHIFDEECAKVCSSMRLAMGGCGCGCGCGCRACWSDTNYGALVPRSDAVWLHHSIKPAQKHNKYESVFRSGRKRSR